MAPDAATITADSSPTEILKSLTPAQTKEWRTTGKLPDIPATPPKETTEAASSTAATTEVTEEPAKAPETSTAPVAVEPKSEKPKGAEARIKELLAANKELEAKLEAARKAPIVAPAKIEEVAKPHRNDVDPKTGLPVYASDEAFDTAFESYLTAKVTADVEKRTAKAQADARAAEQNKIIEQRWQNSLKIANEKHTDFAKVLGIDEKGAFHNEALKTIKSNSVVDAWILDSDIGAEMLYHFAKNPEDLVTIQEMNAFRAARALTKLEETLSGKTATPPKETPAPRSEATSVTRAPAPPASISGKATAPADEVEAAVKTEDFRRFQKAANAEEFAKKRKAS